MLDKMADCPHGQIAFYFACEYFIFETKVHLYHLITKIHCLITCLRIHTNRKELMCSLLIWHMATVKQHLPYARALL